MNNSKYYKIIKDIKVDIAKNGITTDIIDDLKALRKMVVDENQPLLAKTLRLIYQHIEENETFNVSIPEDEPIEGEEVDVEMTTSEINPVESLDYLLSNLLEPNNKTNIADIRDYVAKLKEIAGEDW